MPRWFLPLACTANLAKNLAAVRGWLLDFARSNAAAGVGVFVLCITPLAVLQCGPSRHQTASPPLGRHTPRRPTAAVGALVHAIPLLMA